MTEILYVNNLSYTYHTEEGETAVLKNIHMSISKGEFISIIGPSGCGKSTLLSLLANLLLPTSGEIIINNACLINPIHAVGYMLQKDHLFEWRTIFQNILLGLEITHTKNNDTIAYANQLLEKYGLSNFKHYKPSQLSGGMRQRVALIRTLVLKPDILLLDEPFSALDYQTRLSVADDIYSIIKSEEKTAILVTHDIGEAISMADRIFILSERPSSIKKVVDIKFPLEHRTPLRSRSDERFRDYFNDIWEVFKNV